ncbi:TPA: YbaK/prolyl-tRNA synthetase associated domain-containing protein [Providencia alcalifaciens]
MSDNDVFTQLTQLLNSQNAKYRVMEHPTAGKSEEVAKIRGTQLGQGAKGLVCHVKGNGVRQHVLAILPADQQADLSKIAKAIGGTRASLASPKEVDELTHCFFGAIPPFSFHPSLKLIADPYLFVRFDELAFNAGSLERSIILNTQDYQRIASPTLVEFIHTNHELDIA